MSTELDLEAPRRRIVYEIASGAFYEVEVTFENLKLQIKRVRSTSLGRPFYYPELQIKKKSSTSVYDNEFTEWPVKARQSITSLNDPKDYVLNINLINGNAADDVNSLVGSARLHLSKVIAAVGFGNSWTDELDLTGPSGSVEGKARVTVVVRELTNSALANGQKSYAQPNDQVKKRKRKSQNQNTDYGNADMKLKTQKNARIFNFWGVVNTFSGFLNSNN